MAGDGELSEGYAFIVRGYLMMSIHCKSVFFQQGSDTMQEKAVLEDSAGKDDGVSAGVERHALFC